MVDEHTVDKGSETLKTNVVVIEEFLRRLKEKKETPLEGQETFTDETSEEALIKVIGCLNRMLVAHEALYAFLLMHEEFIVEHSSEHALQKYHALRVPLFTAYMEALKRVAPSL